MGRMMAWGPGLALAMAATPAAATILTFDEPDAGPVFVLSTDPYVQKGLTFTSPYQHGVWYPAPDQNAGNGTQVFENGYSDLTIVASDGHAFTLNGFDYGAGIYASPPYGFTILLTLADTSVQSFAATATDMFQHWDAGGVSVTQIVLSAPQGWLAIDNLDFRAVPEPANWALMLLGFGLAGGALRQRRGRVSFGL